MITSRQLQGQLEQIYSDAQAQIKHLVRKRDVENMGCRVNKNHRTRLIEEAFFDEATSVPHVKLVGFPLREGDIIDPMDQEEWSLNDVDPEDYVYLLESIEKSIARNATIENL